MDKGESGEQARQDLGQIAGGAWFSLVGRLANGGLVLAYGVMLARLADLHTVGVVTLALTIIRILEIVARMGLELGTLHYVAIAEGEGRRGATRPTVGAAVRLVLAFSVPLAVVLAAAAPLLGHWFQMPELAWPLRILALSLPFMSVTLILVTALLGLRRVKQSTLGEKLVLPGLNLAACALFVGAGLGAEGAAAAYVLAAVCTLPIAAGYLRQGTAAAEPGAGAVGAGALLRFSMPLILVILFNQFLMWADTLMLGVLGTAADVAIYGAASRIALTAGIVVGAFNSIFAPTISDLYHRRQMDRLRFLYQTVGKWIFLATLPMVLLMILLATELMQLYGPAFTAGAGALIILAGAQLVGGSTGTVGFMLTMSGHQRIMLLDTVVAAAINFALNALLIPPYGLVGASVATFLSIAAFNLGALAAVWRKLGMHPYNAGYLRVAAAGMLPFVLLGAAKFLVPDDDYLREIVVYTLAFGALYLAALRWFGLSRDDEPIIAALATRFLRKT